MDAIGGNRCPVLHRRVPGRWYAQDPFLKFPGQFQPLTSSKRGVSALTAIVTRPFRVREVLSDAVHMLAAVLFVPVIILAIGTPFALVIAGLLWLIERM